MTLLQLKEGQPVTSECVADSVRTNPSLIRRILSMLADAGLTTARLGTGGGALLARPAKRVTLLDVYRAVEDADLFKMHRTPPSEVCLVGCHILPVLAETTSRAQRAMEAELAACTLADIAQAVLARERSCGRRST